VTMIPLDDKKSNYSFVVFDTDGERSMMFHRSLGFFFFL
jgi:hypothetical protein